MNASILAIASLIVSIVGLLLQYFLVIAALRERVMALETKVEVFWNALSQQVPKMLHLDSTPSRDELLEKLTTGLLEKGEALELKRMLEEDPPPAGSDRMLPYIFTMALVDYEIRKEELENSSRGWDKVKALFRKE